MKHGSLFSGIGGFDLAAQWMGWTNVFHCEWNPFGQKVLKHYWPEAESFNDITKTDFTKYADRIDVISGGFPCQPYSAAGKRLGKEDERHLWPEMLRAICEISPCWVVGENVRGLTNWNGGVVFDEVQADLESAGYEVLPFLLPACAVNAPHRRDRIWFIAHAGHAEPQGWDKSAEGQQHDGRGNAWREPSPLGGLWDASDTCVSGLERSRDRRVYPPQELTKLTGFGPSHATANTDSHGLPITRHEPGKQAANAGVGIKHDNSKNESASDTDSRRQPGKEYGQESAGRIAEACLPNDWSNFPTQSPLCGRNDGIPTGLDGSGFSASQFRNESIKAYGNAIVPQVALQIFKAIAAYEQKLLP